MIQLNLFSSINEANNQTCGVDKNEAPDGFYAVAKNKAITPNICNSCDAKSLCNKNENDWCLKNRCMSYEMVAFKDGKTYGRKDRKSVYFKRQEL